MFMDVIWVYCSLPSKIVLEMLMIVKFEHLVSNSWLRPYMQVKVTG